MYLDMVKEMKNIWLRNCDIYVLKLLLIYSAGYAQNNYVPFTTVIMLFIIILLLEAQFMLL
jgi:hypothetical protein